MVYACQSLEYALAEVDAVVIDMALAEVLRGGEFSYAEDVETNVSVILRRIGFHGIAGLLGDAASDRLPPILRNEVRHIAVSQAFWEVQHVRRLRPLLDALDECGARPLIFKGTALAYTHYVDESTRSRGDSDILVRESAFEAACHIVSSFGFTAPISGLSAQALGAKSFSLKDEHGFRHEIDLHSRINSSPVIARLFPHDELLSRSEPILKIGSGARALGPADALLVACFHRLIHSESPYHVDGRIYRSSDRLIWLYDIKLLRKTLTGLENQDLLKLAQEKGLSAVLADGLAAADQWFDPDGGDLIRDLKTPREKTELPYRYFNGGPARRWMLDFAATERKGRALKDLLIPSREHMEAKYGPRLLKTPALAYIWRALHGLYKAALR